MVLLEFFCRSGWLTMCPWSVWTYPIKNTKIIYDIPILLQKIKLIISRKLSFLKTYLFQDSYFWPNETALRLLSVRNLFSIHLYNLRAVLWWAIWFFISIIKNHCESTFFTRHEPFFIALRILSFLFFSWGLSYPNRRPPSDVEDAFGALKYENEFYVSI